MVVKLPPQKPGTIEALLSACVPASFGKGAEEGGPGLAMAAVGLPHTELSRRTHPCLALIAKLWLFVGLYQTTCLSLLQCWTTPTAKL
jgi:hypothetical protein